MTWAAQKERKRKNNMPIIRQIPVAQVGEIAVGKTKSFRFGIKNGIAYNDGGVIKAYLNFCPHMGGSVDLVNGEKFRCRMHFAEFDAKSGDRLSGEAPEGTKLQHIELTEKDGQLFATLVLHDDFDF